MRIAMIGSRGLPAGVGGVERVVERLTRGLVARGHEVLVYGRRNYVGAARPNVGRCVVTTGLSGKHGDAFTHTATACWDVLRRDVDVVHVHSPGPAIWSWLPALRRPVVLTVHAPDWRREKWSPPAKLALQAGLAVGLRVAKTVTAVSKHLAEELHERSGRSIEWIPNGAPEISPSPARGARSLSLPAGGFALHVGRIVPEKRLHVLLDAWSRAKLPWPLLVAAEDGEPGYTRRCRRMAPPGVQFLGPQFGANLAELYANAAMVIQPSVLEGASLVLLEAAAWGRCLIVADIPANREILGEAGVYVPPDESGELARQIVRYSKDTALRESLGRNAQRRVQEAFSMDDIVVRYQRVYERLL